MVIGKDLLARSLAPLGISWALPLTGVLLLLAGTGASAQTMGGGTGAAAGGPTSGGGASGAATGAAGASSSGTGATPAGAAGFAPQSAAPTVSIGNTLLRGTGTGGAAIPSSSNPLGPYYGNLYTPGTTSAAAATGQFTQPSGFGQPLYATVSTTAAAGTPGAVGATAATQSGAGFTTFGIPRSPAYYTALSEDFVMPRYPPEKLKNDVQAVLQRSSSLKAQGNIQVVVKGAVVVLRGDVKGARERRLAEALVRMSPGVRDVQNELQVTTPDAAQSLGRAIRAAAN